MERLIGERFEYDERLIEVVEGDVYDSCDECMFLAVGNCPSVAGQCSFLCRTDGKSVVFKEVKDDDA